MKKLLSLFLALLMVFMLFPVSALADGDAAGDPSAEEVTQNTEGAQSDPEENSGETPEEKTEEPPAEEPEDPQGSEPMDSEEENVPVTLAAGWNSWTSSSDKAQELVNCALAQKGKTESELSVPSNLSGVWCAWFVSTCAQKAGVPDSIIPNTGNTQTANGYGITYAYGLGQVTVDYCGGRYLESGETPRLGDLVVFNGKHIGIMTSATEMVSGNDGGKVVAAKVSAWYDQSSTKYVRPNYSGTSTTKPDKTKDMSVDDYMTYYAQSVTSFSGTGKPKSGTLKLYRLPETLNNTVSYTTTTGSVRLVRKIVNSAGNTWYETSTGAFAYSGDITIVASPTIDSPLSEIFREGLFSFFDSAEMLCDERLEILFIRALGFQQLIDSYEFIKIRMVDVFFEEQNIHSISAEGELMLTILASFAQAESLSASENQKWRIRKNFEEGKPWNNKLFGYCLADGRFEVVPEEAEIVQRIFSEYLSGRGTTAIANGLNADGILTRRGYAWRPNVIAQTLRNYNYTGNLILQKTYRENHLTKRKLMNDGVLPKYHVSDSHEAIIDPATFESVQAEIERRAETHGHTKSCAARYPFSGLIVCANCGKHYRRKTTKTGIVWICATFNTVGKAACASKQIPEERLLEMTADIDSSSIEQITAEDGNHVRILLSDGTEIVRRWEDRSRAESWTDEMKDAARQRTLERNKHNG